MVEQVSMTFVQDDIEKLVSKLEDKVRALEEGSCMDAIIFPLHGSLPPELQASSFHFSTIFLIKKSASHWHMLLTPSSNFQIQSIFYKRM